MAQTIAEAFAEATEAAEHARRIALEAVPSVSARATVWECMATWDREKVESMGRIIAGYRRKHGFGDSKCSDEDEDAFQDAVADMLAYPRQTSAGLDPDSFTGLMVWRASRRWGGQGRREKRQFAENVISLDSVVGNYGGTFHDFLTDHRPEESAEWMLEWWYLKVYVKHLLSTTTMTVAELSDELGVKGDVIQAIIIGFREEEGSSSDELASTRRHPKTKEHIVALLRDFVAHYGRAPTYKEIQERTRELPPARHIYEVFGTRHAAFEAAGIEAPTLKGVKANKVELADELVTWARKHSRWPGQNDIGAASDLRSTAVYQRVFGSTARRELFDAVRELLGDDRMTGIERPGTREFVKEDVETAIRGFHEKHGRWPMTPDYMARTDGLPTPIVMRRIFGTTNTKKIIAALAAGQQKGSECMQMEAA